MIDLLENIAGDRPRGVALMGLDVGTKTIGVAVCDPDLCLATPVATIKRTKFKRDLEALRVLIADYEIGGYVIGYPVNMDGTEGRKCQSIRDFAHEFEKQIGGENLWIALADERLSTHTVEHFVDHSVGMSKRKAKEQGVIDKLAAQVILQGAIEYLVGTYKKD